MKRSDDTADSKPATRDENYKLLDRRLTMLGLDRHVIESGDGETFELIKRRCRTCGAPEACAADLKRDPNNPVWETYCPNAWVFNALLKARWLIQITMNYWHRHYPQD